MQAQSATLRLTLLLVAAVVFSGRPFCQPTTAQGAPAGVNPATGLPVGSSTGSRINPATGLPAAAPNRPAQIEPATQLPLPPPRAHLAASAADLDPLAQAREARSRGRFEEALQCYLAYYNKTRLSVTSGPLSAALSDWVALGKRYPQAKQALLIIRDNGTQQFVDGHGNRALFSEVVTINAALGEQEASYALFLGLEQADVPLAGECYSVLESELVERGAYEVCGRHGRAPQDWFNILRSSFEVQRGMVQDAAERHQAQARQLQALTRTNIGLGSVPPVTDSSDPLLKSATGYFVPTVNRLLEILVATGRQAEAESIRAQALATVDAPGLWPTLSDLEAKVRTVQASRRPPPAPLLIHPQFFERTTLFAANPPEPAASVERWAPACKPGDKVDVYAVFSEAKNLAAANDYEEALQHLLWYFNHALEYDPGQRGVRLSSGLADWVALARKYPKAGKALLEVRDRKVQRFAASQGSVALFKDIVSMDDYLGHERTTCRLFKYLHEQQSPLAKGCYALAENALVKQGEYALCLAYVGNGQARFEQHRKSWEWMSGVDKHNQEMQQRIQQGQNAYWAKQGQKPPAGVPRYAPPRLADRNLVGDTRQLVEILVAGGHKADAENICAQALALVDDPRLRSAVADAEKKCSR